MVAVETLLTMDITLHYFEDIEQVIVMEFSDPVTGVVGSCAVRVRVESDDESSSSD